jgi:hypothetical protein
MAVWPITLPVPELTLIPSSELASAVLPSAASPMMLPLIVLLPAAPSMRMPLPVLAEMTFRAEGEPIVVVVDPPVR